VNHLLHVAQRLGEAPVNASLHDLLIVFHSGYADLVRAGCLTPEAAARHTRLLQRDVKDAKILHRRARRLLEELLHALEDGSLREGLDFVRPSPDRVALRITDCVRLLEQCGRFLSTTGEHPRTLLQLAHLVMPTAVLEVSGRAFFGARRQRALILQTDELGRALGKGQSVAGIAASVATTSFDLETSRADSDFSGVSSKSSSNEK